MKKVILYIAASLDGMIADENGGVSWLDAMHADGEDYGYHEFLDSVDTVVMGRRTYEQVLTFGPYPYADKTSYVFSRSHKTGPAGQVKFVSDLSQEWISRIRSEAQGDTWLVGGAELIGGFWEKDWIDEFIISVVPTILGQGIRLFQAPLTRKKLSLESCRTFPTGLVQLKYRRG